MFFILFVFGEVSCYCFIEEHFLFGIHFFHAPFSATKKSSSVNGAFANVVFRNSSSVFQPLSSSLVPVLFSKCPSGALIFFSFEANSFRSFLESCLIWSFSSSVTSCQSEFVM